MKAINSREDKINKLTERLKREKETQKKAVEAHTMKQFREFMNAIPSYKQIDSLLDFLKENNLNSLHEAISENKSK